jgi:DNA-directed RNA polymerase III subunit RPC3
MVSQYGILLAAGLISDHFGPLVAVSPLSTSSPSRHFPPYCRSRDALAPNSCRPIPLSQKVCECLLRHGALQLPEIAHRLKLPRNHLKNSLLVLIQHNCVQAFSSPNGKPVRKSLGCMIGFDALLVRDPDPIFLAVVGAGRRAVTLYLAIFDNDVLHRMRFSKFLSVIRADIPEVLTWI